MTRTLDERSLARRARRLVPRVRAPEVTLRDAWREAWRRLRRAEPATVVLVALVVSWIVVFGILVVQRHDRFGSFGFDMGIFDQAIWLAARGESFITVRGLDLFGHHANVAFYLLAPLSWLGAGPHIWNLLQVATLAAGAVPLYLIGRARRLSPWLALLPAAAYLLHPSTQFLAWELFHPETMAVTPLLFAYLAAVRRRWGWYAGLLVLAVAWKEDVALFALVLGLLVALRGDRRVGAVTMALSLGWFLAVSQVLLSAVNGQGAFYDQFYGHLGESSVGVVTTVLTDPTRVVDHLATADPSPVGYLWKLGAPWALLPLAAPAALLMGVPQLLANLLSINGFTREITFHYAALPMAALGVASVEGLARLAGITRAAGVAGHAGPAGGAGVAGVAGLAWLRRGAAAAVAVAALAATLQWGPSPVGDRYDEGFWPASSPRQETQHEAVSTVPSRAPVSATYQFVPHLTHRERVYEFPNPFRERNWGVRGEDTHDPRVVEWLVVDSTAMGREDRSLVEDLVSSGAFDVVFQDDGVLVARRR